MTTHWAVQQPDGTWASITIDGETPVPEEDWPMLASAPYQAVDTPADDRFEPDGNGGWQPRLDMLRARRWADAKTYRDARAVAGCMTPLGRVQTDESSCLKINGAVTGAMVSQQLQAPFSVDWTMEDNSVVTHDAAAMIALGMAVLSYLSACQAAGTTIRNSIDAADTAETIAAVDIEAGYPGDAP